MHHHQPTVHKIEGVHLSMQGYLYLDSYPLHDYRRIRFHYHSATHDTIQIATTNQLPYPLSTSSSTIRNAASKRSNRLLFSTLRLHRSMQINTRTVLHPATYLRSWLRVSYKPFSTPTSISCTAHHTMSTISTLPLYHPLHFHSEHPEHKRRGLRYSYTLQSHPHA